MKHHDHMGKNIGFMKEILNNYLNNGKKSSISMHEKSHKADLWDHSKSPMDKRSDHKSNKFSLHLKNSDERKLLSKFESIIESLLLDGVIGSFKHVCGLSDSRDVSGEDLNKLELLLTKDSKLLKSLRSKFNSKLCETQSYVKALSFVNEFMETEVSIEEISQKHCPLHALLTLFIRNLFNGNSQFFIKVLSSKRLQGIFSTFKKLKLASGNHIFTMLFSAKEKESWAQLVPNKINLTVDDSVNNNNVGVDSDPPVIDPNTCEQLISLVRDRIIPCVDGVCTEVCEQALLPAVGDLVQQCFNCQCNPASSTASQSLLTSESGRSLPLRNIVKKYTDHTGNQCIFKKLFGPGGDMMAHNGERKRTKNHGMKKKSFQVLKPCKSKKDSKDSEKDMLCKLKLMDEKIDSIIHDEKLTKFTNFNNNKLPIEPMTNCKNRKCLPGATPWRDVKVNTLCYKKEYYKKECYKKECCKSKHHRMRDCHSCY
jgi:hypothetical protein